MLRSLQTLVLALATTLGIASSATAITAETALRADREISLHRVGAFAAQPCEAHQQNALGYGGDASDSSLASRAGTKTAFEIASEGGRHAGQLRQFLKQTPEQLQRSIRSFEGNIAKHEGWIANPTSKVPNWGGLSPQHQQNLMHHWGQDVARAREYMSIAGEVLRGLK